MRFLGLAVVVALFVNAQGLFGQEKTLVAWEFATEGDTEGWTALHSLSPLQVAAGALRTTITGSDPYMASPWGLSIPGDSAVVIIIRMRISGNQRDAEFFWTTSEHPNFVAGLETGFALIPDGRFHVYEVPVGRHPEWRGTVTRLRLDPGTGIAPGQDPVPVEIDYIRVVERGPRPEIEGFGPTRSWIAVGDTFVLRLRVKNVGARVLENATATVSLPPLLSTSDALTKQLPPLQPGSVSTLEWIVKAQASGSDSAVVVLQAPGLSPAEAKAAVTVHAGLPDLPAAIPSGRQIVQLQDGSWLVQTPVYRLAVLKTDSLYGLLRVFVAERGQWRLMGTLRLPSLALRNRAGEIWQREIPFQSASHTHSVDGDTLKLLSAVRDGDGQPWTVGVTLFPADSSLFVAYRFVPGAAVQILNAAGPALRIGDGAFGDQKSAAIFPGLEWLVDGENSSSTLDVHEPGNLRFYPDPHRVTAPFISLSAQGRTVLFSWDPLQEWAPGLKMPNPVFASPDVLENLDAHLVGLVVPSVGQGRVENQPVAADPLPLDAGGAIQISARIAFIPQGEALAGLRHWLRENDLPPLPQSSVDEMATLHRGLRCFMFRLWVPSAQGWHLVLDDPWGPRFDANVAVDAWLSSALETSVALGVGTRRTLYTAASALVQQNEAGALGWGFPFRAGFLEEAWGQRIDAAVHLTASQRDDGGWDYSDDPKLQNMPGTTVGTCARRAYVVLRAARITGNPYLTERGLKALAFMERFNVPRGAQTWEVPLHAPDVLAAANAVQAYLEGFRLTGRRAYVDRALYWARTSLPFLYLWSAEDRPIMVYGSIPVFGATWYTGAWFGRVVQWNGLELAYSLSKLAEVTGDTTWQYLARGLVRHGMQLQDYTAAHYPENDGMYPDAFDMTTGEEAYHWDLSPELIQRNVLRFQGLDPDVHTCIVPAGAGSLNVSAGWPVQAHVSDSLLVVTVHPTLADSGFVAVAGVSKPGGVALNGSALAEVTDVDSVRLGWHYAPTGVLFVKVLAQLTTAELRISGVHAVRRTTGPHWDFQEPDYLEGWSPNQYLRDVRVTDGVVSCVSTWLDPYLEGPFGRWPAASFDSAYVVLSVDKGTTGQLFWSRTDEPFFSESKSVQFQLQADGQFHRVGLRLRGHREWKGTILRLRLDPTNASNARIRIDGIWLSGTPSGVNPRKELPLRFALSPAYPNPFNPDTQFVLALPRKARVRAVVYDVRGRRVATLLDRALPPGRHRIRWNGGSTDGRQLASGIYVVRVEAVAPSGRAWTASRKVALLK